MTFKRQVESLWLSDIHLGCKDCKAEFLLHFLQTTEAKRIFLVGDIIDFWALQRKMRWPEAHNQVLNLLLTRAQQGVEVIYLPGNHDELAKPYDRLLFGSVKIKLEHIHTTLSGKKLLMLHGDKFDQQVCFGKFEAKLGDALYDLLLFLNRQFHALRKLFGLPYWSLSSYIKGKVKGANEAINRYKNAALNEAKLQNTDGIICGHIHHPQLIEQNGLIYCNDGDWIENCTCLVETQSGDLQLLKWKDGEENCDVINEITLSKPMTENKRKAA